MSVRRLDRCTPSLTPLPSVCFHLCHTKVLIRSALTRFIVCLPAGKQAHYSFARTFITVASSLCIERGCVCPQTVQVCSSSLILFCIILCGVFGSAHFGRASLACLGCPCCGWPLPACFSGGFPPWCCRAPPFFAVVRWFWCCCCLLSCLFWRLGCLRLGLLFPGFPPSLPPWLSSGAFWSSQSCWSLPPGFWLYLQRSGCHTFGMACRG